LIAAWAGDFDETDRCMEIVAAMAERLEQPTFLWFYVYTSATQAMIAGDTDEAERLARQALEIGIDSGQPDATSQFGAQIMTVAAQRGTMGELAPLILQATVDLPSLPAFRGALAMAYAEGDRTAEARSLLEAFAATGFDLPLDVSWLTGMTCYSEAAIECRDIASAGPLFDLLKPWAVQFADTGVSTTGSVSHFLGGLACVLGRHEESNAYFEQASALHGGRTKWFAARTNLSWGRMLLERRASGDTEKAERLLTKAMADARQYGYGTVERRASMALQQVG
jgi:tetratricopeptide (TPR) repeat protein